MTWATAVVTDSEPETKPAAYVAPKAKSAKAASSATKTGAAEAAAAAADKAEAGKSGANKTHTENSATLEKPAKPAVPAETGGSQRYGESVVREILGASFLEEQSVEPRVRPRDQ